MLDTNTNTTEANPTNTAGMKTMIATAIKTKHNNDHQYQSSQLFFRTLSLKAQKQTYVD